MTMSVGLGRIITDPAASVLVRKALGTLSTPGLLVYDDALTIDDTGRITLRLNPNGGLSKDSNGLAIDSVLNPPATSILVGVGIDSHWNLPTDGGGRRWNARLTGSAPNYFESGLAIGEERFTGESSSGEPIDDAKLQVNYRGAQLRLSYDNASYVAFRALLDATEMYVVGDTGTYEPFLHIMTGDGTYGPNTGGLKINNGTVIKQIAAYVGNFQYTGGGVLGGVSWEDYAVTWSFTAAGYHEFNANTDFVTAVPKGVSGLPAQVMSHSARISAANQVTIRISWFDVLAPWAADWLILIHRMEAV